MNPAGDDGLSREILRKLRDLEERIERIEAQLGLESPGAPEQTEQISLPILTGGQAEDRLESQIGENWFARAGITVLAIGIAFLLTFPFHALPPWVPPLAGYAIVGGIFLLYRFWRASMSQISRYLLGGGLLLLYFTTLRLRYFGAGPLVNDLSVELALLLASVAVSLLVAISAGSQSMAGIGLTLASLTGLIGGGPLFVELVVLGVAVIAAALRLSKGWDRIPVYAVLLAYATVFLWSINNPFFTQEIRIVTGPVWTLFLVLTFPVVFASGVFLRRSREKEEPVDVLLACMNGLGSYGLFLLLSVGMFREHVASMNLLASLVMLAMAILFWVRERSRYSTFIYAMLGYLALSVAIVAQFSLPDCFVWLAWQSILVVSTAVWFRSRFIVVANFFIYLVVFLCYLVLAGTVSVTSLSFGFVALLSARILNWQKQRLELKTELMRNAYLGSALLVFPYALYHSVPEGYVGLSWTGVALFYYVMSLILRNRKYRWMSLMTFIMTVGYVFLVDLINVEPTFRIISFLVLGAVLLGIAVSYARRRARGSR